MSTTAELPAPESAQRALRLRFDQRAEYWEGEAVKNSRRADEMREQGEIKAARMYDEFAASARVRAASERKCWINQVLGDALSALEAGHPGTHHDLQAVVRYLDGVLA